MLYQLAALKHERAHTSEAEIAATLSGNDRDDHVFVLKQELALDESDQQQIAACNAPIEHYLAQRPSPLADSEQPQPQPVRRKPRQNQPSFDLKTHLHRIIGVDFCAIDGLSPSTVQTILSEVGLAPTRFGSAKQFASWLGLSPGNNISGGKRKSAKTRKVVNRAANALPWLLANQTLPLVFIFAN